MSDLDARFAQAQQDVKQLPERPGNLTLLRLYALFKQATEGDAHGDASTGLGGEEAHEFRVFRYE